MMVKQTIQKKIFKGIFFSISFIFIDLNRISVSIRDGYRYFSQKVIMIFEYGTFERPEV
jgi:hypothetical protein